MKTKQFMPLFNTMMLPKIPMLNLKMKIMLKINNSKSLRTFKSMMSKTKNSKRNRQKALSGLVK